MKANLRGFYEVKSKRSYIRKVLFLALLCAFVFLVCPLSSAQAATWHVDKDATGSNNGISWENAYTDLQDALASAIDGDDIWVAEGTYTPTTVIDRTATFQLKSGVALYGGFNGDETSLDQRVWTDYDTVLSGDVNGDDIGFTNNGENVFHVVTGADDATIDGFTITGGNANGSSTDGEGGGMYNYDADATITNCTFSGNNARNTGSAHGGGIFSELGSLTIDNCTFSGNEADDGGGIYNKYLEATTIISNCTFSENTAYSNTGGGIANEVSSITITNCIFLENEALTTSGAYRGGGAINNGSCNPTITNCIFSGNTTTDNGGAIHNTDADATITNCTFSGNDAAVNGGAIYNEVILNDSSFPIITNCILWGDSATTAGPEIYDDTDCSSTVTYCDVQGGYSGTGNIDEDPLFVVVGNDYRLQAGPPSSPCIDAGDNDAPALPTEDLDGYPRILTATVDMGAYEYHSSDIYFTVTGTTAMTAGGSQTITITAYDPADEVDETYEGSKSLIFSGANPSPDATIPTCEDELSADIAFGSVTSINFSAGVGTCIMKLYKAEVAHIKATQGSISTSNANDLDVTVSLATATTLVFTTEPGGGTAGGAWATQPIVEVQDDYGNTITTDSTTEVTVAIDTNPGIGILSGTATVTVSSGVATFSGLSIDKVGAGYTLAATSDPVYTPDTSSGFDITASGSGYLRVTGTGTMTAGTGNELTITAYDTYDNVATGYSGDKTLTFTGPANSPDGTSPTVEGSGISSVVIVPFTNGVSGSNAATLVAYMAEATTVDVSDGLINSGGDPSYDLDLTVSVATKNKLLWVTQPSSPVEADVTWNAFSIEITDQYGNRTSGSDNVMVSPSDGSFGGTSNKAASAGLVTFDDITYHSTADITITVTGAATGLTATPASNDVEVNFGDSDSDGMLDTWEIDYFGDLSHDGTSDGDNDGLSDLEEYQNNTNPINGDTDDDDMPDGWEVTYDLDPVVKDADDDLDGDGYSNLQEYLSGTEPNNINSVPQPPITDAGPDQTVDENEAVTLFGSNSTDLDDGIASYLWEQTGGTTSVTLSDPTAVQPIFVAPEVGVDGESLTFKLTVTDNGGLESTDTCIVNVTDSGTGVNQPPTADAGPDQTVDEGETVTLDGTGSSDPDGDTIHYNWIQIGGPLVTLSDATVEDPTFVLIDVDENGESLIFELTVTDDEIDGLKSTDVCIVNVIDLTGVNNPPTADAGLDQTVDEGETVTLDGTGSSDPDLGDGIASYLWKQTGGTTVTLSDTTYTMPTFVTPPVDLSGTTLTFQLTVTDNGGLEGSAEVSITIDDNSITNFSEDVITTTSSTNESIGIKVANGGNLVSLEVIDPSTIADTTDRPEDLVYGLIDMQIKCHDVGGSVFVTIYLPEPAPDGYKWYKYGSNLGWYDYSDHAVFNIDRTQVTLALTDGGIGDDDNVAGMISDPSGLGTAPTTPPVSGGGGGGGGCFIATAAYGSYAEKHVMVLREFRDHFLLTNPVGELFVGLYYTYSPPMADYIAHSATLRAFVRFSLIPLVSMSWMALHLSPTVMIALTLLLLILIGASMVALLRRMGLQESKL